ncbi:MAG: hypothetical protein ACLSGO_15160 [Lachnospiraceae bacterium]
MKNRESQKIFKIVSSPYGGLVPKSSLSYPQNSIRQNDEALFASGCTMPVFPL